MAHDKKKLIYIIGIAILILFLYYNNQPKVPITSTSPTFSSLSIKSHGGSKIQLTSNSRFLAPNIFTATLFCVEGNCCGDYACAGECLDCPGGGSICCTQEGAYLSPQSCDGSCVLPQRSYCKTSDPSWCCYDHSLQPCSNDADVCGTAEWCENWRNGDKSCYGGSCCDNAGYIIDYNCIDSGNTYCCCPQTNPFRDDGIGSASLCYIVPQPTSRNWFTNQNQCSPNDDPCGGTSYNPCVLVNFIYQRQSLGEVVGQCGVECTAEGCNGLNSTRCTFGFKKIDVGKVIGKCGVECLNNYCNKTDLIICNNYKNSNQGKVAGSCGVECTKDSCDGRNYIECVNYMDLNKGPVIGKCGVECLGDSVSGDYTCAKNWWIKTTEVTSQSYLDTTPENYYRFSETTDSCTYMKLHPSEVTDYDYKNISNCEANIKPSISAYAESNITVYENKTIAQKAVPTSFDWSRFSGILFLVILIGALIIIYLRRKK